MIKRLHQVVAAIRDKGFIYTLSQILFHLLGFPAGLAFAAYDRITSHDYRGITIMIRGNNPESDTYALLREIEDLETAHKLTILSRQQVDDTQLTLWDSDDVSITLPGLHTLSSFRDLSQSSIVLCKNDSHLKWYRIFDTSDRRYIRIYHGPITKAYGSTNTASKPRTIAENISLIDISPRYRSVNSDTERYFRASAEGRHPGRFPKWGYPRFDRLYNFRDGEDDPVLPEATRDILYSENKYTNILYAPTQKGGSYSTTFFPFPDFDSGRIRAFCDEQNIRIFLRPHPNDDPKHDHLVDNTFVYLADQQFANSATELIPFMDGLVTDYSSIYLECLPLDCPIVFVKDNHKEFKNVQGIAFDYERYFPGPKPDTLDEFMTNLGNIANGEDEHSGERAFVRETFVPERSQTFLEAVRHD